MADMDMFFNRIRNFFGKWFLKPKQDAALLRSSFKEHYKTFRSLLTANNNALELMAEMEQTITAGRPFSMAFVRGHCTALSVNVYKMTRQLQAISNGKYGDLTHTFKSISSGLEAVLARRPEIPEGKFILSLDEIDKDSADLTGEKMANLGEVRNRVGLNVPDGFVITAAASLHFIKASGKEDEIRRRLKTLDYDNLEELYRASTNLQQLIINAPLPDAIEQEIIQNYRDLKKRSGRDVLVALRSSAVGEDSGSTSFAGQYRTQLNVSEEFLGQTYKEILASKYKSQAIIYRLQRGFLGQDVIMCVGCLAMVDAVVSGVLYSRTPENPRSDRVVIIAAPGLAGQVVSGSTKADVFQVERQSPHKIITRDLHVRKKPETSLSGDTLTLNGEYAAELTRIAVRLEDHFGVPQDIEWSIDKDGRIIILQSRPLGSFTILEGEAEISDISEDKDALLSGGVMACKGVASGEVHIVRSNIDLLLFPEGAVLVVAHPLPEWASVLSKAVAIVSETGQVAAHLATVAREFGIPALFGLENATTVIKNGMTITVDATGRNIYAGRREDILSQATAPPNLMLDSPMYKLLQEALTFITPLHLTDPGSPFFRPSSCRTFHDLTRFCHEKAVTEMFAFGSKHGFDEKAAKQLVGEMPFQWWVIDLEDGFREGAGLHDKFIHIDDIVSVPMRAIWEGMTALPWGGPPPVSLRGFGSIILQSTMNPSLDPAVRSPLAERNYFLVARNFCNLSVRLGYHFALVEAYISDLLTESYVSFQFKGGAADETRRFIRVQLLKDVLQRFDFRVEQKADSLIARIEKKPSAFLIERLKIMGYLLIHTRQIDMAMGERGMVDNYREKILADVVKVLAVDNGTSSKG